MLNDYKEIIERNWSYQFDKFNNCILSWNHRSLPSLHQRARVLSVFALSKVWYRAQVLPLPDNYAKKFEIAISRFVWRGHLTNDVLPRDTVCLPRERGGLGIPHLKLRCKSLFLRQIFRSVTGQGQSKDHFDFWLGKRMNIPFLQSCFYHITGARGSERDLTPQLFKYALNVINQVFDENIITPADIFSITTKQLYMSLSESLPPAGIEERYVDNGWSRTWHLLSSRVLSSEASSALYLLVHERVGTRERGHRLMPNRYTTSTCPRCNTYEESMIHHYIQCGFVSDVCSCIMSTILHLDPFLSNLDDMSVLQLRFPASIHDNAIVWLLGNYIDLVEKEVVCKHHKLDLPQDI